LHCKENQNKQCIISSLWRLIPGAGDVFVLDLLRLFGLVAGQVVGVPDYDSLATSGCLRRKISAYSEAVGSSFWSANFADSMAALAFVAHAAVEDGELIVGGQVVRVDGLQALVGFAGHWGNRAAGSS
jgi:hypothetical protein